MQNQSKKKTNQNYLEEYLVYEDKNKLNTLNTTIKVRPSGAYLALIGVDTKELAEAFKNYLLNKKTNREFLYKSEQIVDEIILSEDDSTLVIDIFNLPENFDIKNIVQNFRFNRDFIPDKKLRIIILASNDTLDYFSEKAYDFVTFNNFYGKFKDSKFRFEYKVNREKLDRLIEEYKNLKVNVSRKIRIEKMINIIKEAEIKGEMKIALKYLNIVLSKVEKEKDVQHLCQIYNYFGNIYLQTSKYKLAIDFYNKGLVYAKQISDYKNEVNIYVNLGVAYYYLHDIENALKLLFKALEIAERINSEDNLIKIYTNLGNFSVQTGNLSEGLVYYNKSNNLAKKNNDKISLSNNLMNIGNIYRDEFDYKNAIKNYNLSLKIGKEISYSLIIVDVLNCMALLDISELNFFNVVKNLNIALKLSTKCNYRERMAMTYINLSYINLIKLNVKKSLLCIDKAFEFYRIERDFINQIDCFIKKFNIYQNVDIEKAKYYLEKANELHLSFEFRPYAKTILKQFGIYYLNINNYDKSIHYLYEVLEFYEGSNDKIEILDCLLNISIVLIKQKQYIISEQKLSQAESLANEIGLKGSQCEVYMAWYDYYKTIKNEEKAKHYYAKANYIIKNSGHKLFEKRLEKIKNSFEN